MKDYSESAFPLPERADAVGRQGMTLRDYFAAMAMSKVAPYRGWEQYAADVYKVADAMLAERAK